MSLCRLQEAWRPAPQKIDALIPNTALKRRIRSRSPRDNFRTFYRVNVPIFVSGVDIQVAFHATGLPESFQDMFALDHVEAWEVDFTVVFDQGTVDSWNEICVSRGSCGLESIFERVPVGARAHSGKSTGHLCSEWIH